MSHVRRNRKGERKKDVGISERRPTRSSHHGLRFAPHKRELTHKQPTTGLKHVSLSFWGERALPCLPSPALLLTSRFNLCLRPDSFGPWDLLCCWAWPPSPPRVPHGTRRERGLDDVLPLRSRATLIWESRRESSSHFSRGYLTQRTWFGLVGLYGKEISSVRGCSMSWCSPRSALRVWRQTYSSIPQRYIYMYLFVRVFSLCT